MTAENEPTPGDRRLNGWKEIAAYFGKGVRTVQRWEKALGLPVHRIGVGNGEIVYALVGELERWQVNAEAALKSDEPEPGTTTIGTAPDSAVNAEVKRGPHRFARIAVLCVGVLLGVIGAASLLHRDTPDHCEADRGELVAVSAAGSRLWHRRFEPPLKAEELQRNPQWSILPLIVEDLDGDREREVLFARAHLSDPRLYCFNSDGTLRFTKALHDTLVFGQGTHPPPHEVLGVAVTPAGKGTTTIWMVTGHNLEFGSALLKLDSQGNERGRYVSNGWISSVQTMALADGRRMVLVGAANNEHKSASLAVLDEGRPFGSAPSANRDFVCLNCPAGAPEAFFVFPRLAVGERLFGYACPVNFIRPVGARFVVKIGQVPHRIESDPEPFSGAALYAFDTHLALISAELDPGYEVSKERLQRRGLLPPNLPKEGDKHLLPVLSWVDGRYKPIYPSGH